ncbi:MAG TPA: O-antigen ligase family protein [Chitinophagaceae bacterium]|nr:O-antigen ligase family protein [Chitinophagaceae bacterium]
MASLAVQIGASIKKWLHYQFIEKKLNTVFGFLLMAVWAVVFVYYLVFVNYLFAIGSVVLVMLITLAVACMLYPYFGYYFTIILSCIIFSPDRILGSAPMPLGMAVELVTYFTFLGTVTKHQLKQEIDRSFWRHPITVMLIIILLYYTIQAVNPSLQSQLGWFNYYRKFISFLAFFFITYCLLNSKERIRFFINFWVVVVTLLALYACKQQIFGFAGWEMRWIMADEKRLELLFQTGMMRKFSILADPAASGVLFASFMVLLLILGLRTSNMKKKWLYFACAAINLYAFMASGTRTSNIILLGGILFYAIATINEKRTVRFVTAAALGFVLLISLPIHNPVLIRIRSTFEGSKDPSAAFRDMNRARIQPYIYSHPIGGGINTCIPEGLVYSPGHYLASFPSDSGYLKIAVEQGWIGLAIALTFYYLIMRTGIKNFYRARAPEIRMWYIALAGFVFGLLIGQFSQIVIGQYPTIFLFYGSAVVFIKLVKYENGNRQQDNLQPL